jgi:hypothetical protein
MNGNTHKRISIIRRIGILGSNFEKSQKEIKIIAQIIKSDNAPNDINLNVLYFFIAFFSSNTFDVSSKYVSLKIITYPILILQW